MRNLKNCTRKFRQPVIILLQIETLETVKKVLIDEKPKNFEECVLFSRKLWEESYANTIKQLLFNFPADQVTEIFECFHKFGF